MIDIRSVELPADDAALARLDSSFVTDVVYDVVLDPDGFRLVERRLSEPLHKHLPSVDTDEDRVWERGFSVDDGAEIAGSSPPACRGGTAALWLRISMWRPTSVGAGSAARCSITRSPTVPRAARRSRGSRRRTSTTQRLRHTAASASTSVGSTRRCTQGRRGTTRSRCSSHARCSGSEHGVRSRRTLHAIQQGGDALMDARMRPSRRRSAPRAARRASRDRRRQRPWSAPTQPTRYCKLRALLCCKLGRRITPSAAWWLLTQRLLQPSRVSARQTSRRVTPSVMLPRTKNARRQTAPSSRQHSDGRRIHAEQEPGAVAA